MRPRRPLAIRPRLALFAALGLAGALGACGGEKKYANEYEGRMTPPLVSDNVTWFNAEGSPTLASFRGKVVFLEFGFLR